MLVRPSRESADVTGVAVDYSGTPGLATPAGPADRLTLHPDEVSVSRTLLLLSAAALWALPAAAQQPAGSATAKPSRAKAPAMTADTTHSKTDSSRAGAKHAMGHDHQMGAMGNMSDPDHAVAGGGVFPAGWAVRTDRNAATTNVKFGPMGDGLHVTLGPAAIFYRASDKVTGPFHALATFTQTKAPMHPEGYGLFIGGRALDGEGQHYLYFLVRGDGKYLVKRRDGANTTTVQDWTASPAVHTADSSGKATNLLEVDQKSDPSKVVFKVNGQPVWSADAKSVEPAGIVGLRVNHNLDVHVSGFAIHR